MRRQTAAAVLLLVLCCSAAPASADFFGNLLTSLAKEIFRPDGAQVDTSPIKEAGAAPVITGQMGRESLDEVLDDIVEEEEKKEGKVQGQAIHYEGVEQALEAQLAEDMVEIEEAVVNQQKQIASIDNSPEAQQAEKNELAEVEEAAYDEFEAKVEKAKELVEEFDATQEMAEAIAEDYGEDVEVVVADEDGNMYAVDSHLGQAGEPEIPTNSQLFENAATLAQQVAANGGYTDEVASQNMNTWVHEADQVEEELAEDVQAPQPQQPPPRAASTTMTDAELAQLEEALAVDMNEELTMEEEMDGMEYQLEEEVEEAYEQADEAGMYAGVPVEEFVDSMYEEMDEYEEEVYDTMDAIEEDIEQLADEIEQVEAAEGLTNPDKEVDAVGPAEEFEDPLPAADMAPAGEEAGVEEDDYEERIDEGVEAGRDAEATVLADENALEELEKADGHTPRIRFFVAVMSSQSASSPAAFESFKSAVSKCVFKDIEVAAGYYYTPSDTWEPGFGVFFNETYSEQKSANNLQMVFSVEIIYPAQYNEQDVERFLQRMMTRPVGIFGFTYKHHPELQVEISDKIEYCSQDWTFWKFEGGVGHWDVSTMKEKRKDYHSCWYDSDHPAGQAIADGSSTDILRWDLKDMWFLVAAMVLSGALAVCLVASIIRCCCWHSRHDYDYSEDELPTHHRRHLIAQKLKGKKSSRNPLKQLKRKSERMWRKKQYNAHATPDDIVSMQADEESPMGSSKIQQLAESSSSTWRPDTLDIDSKYGKKFNKKSKFTWVNEYKLNRKLKQQAAASPGAGSRTRSPSGSGSSDVEHDIPVSYADATATECYPAGLYYGHSPTKRPNATANDSE